ncbi:hypothetical protein NDU88_003619 [Pleurodeles waltl]|uniref:Uncharacterized protein n=1 Tax=Pleurodeles waltl TaxID=8319 RepID=A0AAV7Q9W5_PLEWA|nr:hypothetical protein NDU88_003619 [Pleurodeles waltl]
MRKWVLRDVLVAAPRDGRVLFLIRMALYCLSRYQLCWCEGAAYSLDLPLRCLLAFDKVGVMAHHLQWWPINTPEACLLGLRSRPKAHKAGSRLVDLAQALALRVIAMDRRPTSTPLVVAWQCGVRLWARAEVVIQRLCQQAGWDNQITG